MTENKTVSSSSTRDDQTNIGLTCQEVKALREKAWSRTNEGNATSQSLVLYGASKENSEGFHESKMTNTEGVNKGIYFSYPCRRHSCAVVNIPAPCVNKMISHIQDVESKIQEHLKRLCQLQRRMHTLWQEHFKLVVLFSQMRLANFQTDSQESIQKILAVQEESSNLMQHILGFFQTLTDGACENDG
ncbi:CCDC178 isoform 6 [Pan troglodytes]|uniref:CCDC178 isoform 6 n=2 Tax=Pan TaxID=9596 RepID=A0A2J8MLX1_PANTR|nr:CCDC178 isoform 6 [Pan troglodytes]